MQAQSAIALASRQRVLATAREPACEHHAAATPPYVYMISPRDSHTRRASPHPPHGATLRWPAPPHA